MKKMVRPFIVGAILVAGLAVLTGCDFFKSAECEMCQPVEAAAVTVDPGQVLLSINGSSAITKDQFEAFYAIASETSPVGKRDAFNMMVQMELLDRQMRKEGKDKTKDYVQALRMARWQVNSQMLAKELQDSTDVSDRGLESFYNEQRGKNPAFDRPPFIKTPVSIAMQSVEFKDKAAAEEFLKKAKADFAGSAAAGNLEVKDLGNVSQQSQDVNFAIRLKARGLNSGDVELIQTGDMFTVIKAGNKTEAEYSTYSELKEMPQMTQMLSQFKKQMELEAAFMKRLEGYKKGYTLKENEQYFKEEEDKFKEMIAQKMKEQAAQKKEAPAAKKTQPTSVVAA